MTRTTEEGRRGAIFSTIAVLAMGLLMPMAVDAKGDDGSHGAGGAVHEIDSEPDHNCR